MKKFFSKVKVTNWENSDNYYTSNKFFDVRMIALSAILVALLVVIKYGFGFLVGVEFVTFFIVAIGTFLPFRYLILIIPSFILCVGAIYGIGLWWMMYWFIFPTEAFLSRLFRKILGLNNIIFAFWSGFWGFSIIFWYAAQDYFVFGKAMMIANMSSALIPNSIEGLCNFVAGITLFYPIRSLLVNTKNKE